MLYLLPMPTGANPFETKTMRLSINATTAQLGRTTMFAPGNTFLNIVKHKNQKAIDLGMRKQFDRLQWSRTVVPGSDVKREYTYQNVWICRRQTETR